MPEYRGFYRPSHRFRNQISSVYWAIHRVVSAAYPADTERDFEALFDGTPPHFDSSGLSAISNMLVVYVWTLFEVYMKEAYVAIHVSSLPSDTEVRNRNKGWGQMKEWLIKREMFGPLERFDSILGEFCARRNCLVHNEGKVDEQYLSQISRYEVSSPYAEGDWIATDWRYHMRLKDVLVSKFNLFLEGQVERVIRENVDNP